MIFNKSVYTILIGIFASLLFVSSDSYNGNSTELYSTFVDIEESTNIISTDISSLTDNLQSKTRRAVSKLYKSPTGENNPLCDRFSVGDIYKRTIYSPGFPGFYPNNTDCVVVLEAPPGYTLRLDFRDHFNIEPSEGCKFDYLEIRDGPRGYAKQIGGNLCGPDFPSSEIYSTGRFLWLHFHSDDNIEYNGFVIIYDYIPKTSQSFDDEINCTMEATGRMGIITEQNITTKIVDMVRHGTSGAPLDCMWMLIVEPEWKVQLSFLEFKLEKPNDCDSNFVEVFHEQTEESFKIKTFCGSIAYPVTSVSNKMHIRYYAVRQALKTQFKILYTAIREKKVTESCRDDEYDCEDGNCIDASLKCNGQINCRFPTDEDPDSCVEKNGGQSDDIIITIVILGLVLTGLMISFLVNCLRKLLRDQKVIREHIRQSKESKLNELDRISLAAKRSRENLSNLRTNNQRPPKGDHHSNSIQLMDDASSRYYRDIIPIPALSNRSDSKQDTLYRNPELTTESGGDCSHHSPTLYETGMCDMACQTRESLFDPVIKCKNTQLQSNQNTGGGGTLRFSTFGYDTPSSDSPSTKTQREQSVSTVKKPSNQHIEMEDIGQTILHVEGYCRLHKKPIKLEETRAYVDIRNSAPDVIIMTSH